MKKIAKERQSILKLKSNGHFSYDREPKEGVEERKMFLIVSLIDQSHLPLQINNSFRKTPTVCEL